MTDVTLLDANHCPGAVLLLFKIRGQGQAQERGRSIDCSNAISNGMSTVGNDISSGDYSAGDKECHCNTKSGTKRHLDSRGSNDSTSNSTSSNNINSQNGDKYLLHTGDMRYHPCMKEYGALRDIKVDRVYLDTTYAHPKHKVSE